MKLTKADMKNWTHEAGSDQYATADGRGKVIVTPTSISRWSYEAWLDGAKIGRKSTRGAAMNLVRQKLTEGDLATEEGLK
jgi:hypothetical protein